MGRWYSQVGEVLDDWGGMFRRSGLPTGLLPVWAEVVGEDAAAHCRPVRLTRKGVLTIAVSDGGWSQELSYLQPEILTKLQEIQDKPVVSLRFHLAPRTFQSHEPKRERNRTKAALHHDGRIRERCSYRDDIQERTNSRYPAFGADAEIEAGRLVDFYSRTVVSQEGFE